VELGQWLQQHAAALEPEDIGFALWLDHPSRSLLPAFAFATRSRGWYLPYGPLNDVRQLSNNILKNLLTKEREAPRLITRDLWSDVATLKFQLDLTNDQVYHLTQNFVGEMKSLEHCTGRPILDRDNWPNGNAIMDAFDVITVGKQMEMEVPKYYRDVRLPLMRSMALDVADSAPVDERQIRCTIIYENLLLKVLTHYTQDPSLIKVFADGEDPWAYLIRVLDMPHDAVVSFLLWICCGEDEAVMAQYHNRELQRLPEQPQLVLSQHIYLKLPTLQAKILQIREQFKINSSLKTRYGRRTPWGAYFPQAFHQMILGSVQDILEIALVTLHNDGLSARVLGNQEQAWWYRATISGRTDQEPMEVQRRVEQMMTLKYPLDNVRLEAKVALG